MVTELYEDVRANIVKLSELGYEKFDRKALHKKARKVKKGTSVKICTKCTGGGSESFWVTVHSVYGDMVRGVVANDLFEDNEVYGKDRIMFSADSVMDIVADQAHHRKLLLEAAMLEGTTLDDETIGNIFRLENATFPKGPGEKESDNLERKLFVSILRVLTAHILEQGDEANQFTFRAYLEEPKLQGTMARFARCRVSALSQEVVDSCLEGIRKYKFPKDYQVTLVKS